MRKTKLSYAKQSNLAEGEWSISKNATVGHITNVYYDESCKAFTFTFDRAAYRRNALKQRIKRFLKSLIKL